MTPAPTWAEITGIFVAIGGAIAAWWKRMDDLSSLRSDNADLRESIEHLKEEAFKALRSHEDAMAAKNEELRVLQAIQERKLERLEDTIARKDARIEKLEDDLYGRTAR